MKLDVNVVLLFVVVAVASAIFVIIMNSSGLQAAAPWGLGFAVAYVLFKRPGAGS
jgi:hypothetical protein